MESTHDSNLFFPVREDSLWLPGEIVQIVGTRLVGFKGGNVKGAGCFVISLTKDELLVRGAKSIAFREDDITAYCKNGLDFYNPGHDHLVQDFVGEARYTVDSITRVLIGRFGASTRLTVWVDDGGKGNEKVIGVIVCGFMPKSIMNLANKAADSGILKRSKLMGYNWHAWPLYRRLIERGFKKAAPNAVITVKGKALDEETFRRLVR